MKRLFAPRKREPEKPVGRTLEIPAPARLQEIHLRHCRMITDRLALLEYLPRDAVVAEIGVLAGDFSEEILRVTQPRLLYLIDSYVADDWPSTNRFKAETHFSFVSTRFAKQIAAGKVIVRKGNSWGEIAKIPDSSLDWAYVDAGHDYESVRNDLEACLSKIKPDGLLVLNDYTLCDFTQGVPYGVIHAANEFCIKHRWELLYLALQQHMFNDVVLRRIHD